MALIIWDNSFPADASSQQSMAQSIRTTKEAIAKGVGTSFYWPGSAADQGSSEDSAGQMLLGSHRCMNLTGSANRPLVGDSSDGYVGLVAAGNVALTQGASNTYLQHIGSENTHMLGSSGVEEVVAVFDFNSATINRQSLASTYRWVVEEGTFTVSQEAMGDYVETVTFTSAYNSPPFVFQSTNSTAFSHGVDKVTKTGFDSRGSSFGAAATADPGSVQVWWRSEGTVDW